MTKEKLILDACCGGRMMWYNKNHPNAIINSTKYYKQQAYTNESVEQTRERLLKWRKKYVKIKTK